MKEGPQIAVGSRPPTFKLQASTGHQVSLEDYLNQKNVYLFFVREFR